MATKKTAVKAKTQMTLRTGDDGLIIRTGMAVIVACGLGIGIWAVITLAGGGVASGGILELASDWLHAVLD